MGLSIYIVCSEGTSKPVSHISRTITNSNSSSVSFILSARARLWSLVVWCFEIFGPSEDADVITTLITPFLRSSLCHPGLILIISSYRSAAIRLDIATISPFPSNTSWRCSKWVTISSATCLIRSSLPIKASSCVHFALAFCVSARSSFSNSSSSSATSFLPSLLRAIFASLVS